MMGVIFPIVILWRHVWANYVMERGDRWRQEASNTNGVIPGGTRDAGRPLHDDVERTAHPSILPRSLRPVGRPFRRVRRRVGRRHGGNTLPPSQGGPATLPAKGIVVRACRARAL